MSIGRGWAPEEEAQTVGYVASVILKETLNRIFNTHKEQKNERQTQGRHESEKEEGDEA